MILCIIRYRYLKKFVCNIVTIYFSVVLKIFINHYTSKIPLYELVFKLNRRNLIIG